MGKLFLCIFLLIVATVSTGLAILITSFAGSGNNPPTWYFVYLGLTQGLPILAYAISWLIIAFSVFSDEPPKLAGKMLGISVLVYLLSFVGLVLIGWLHKELA